MAAISRAASKRLRLQVLDLMLAGGTSKSVAEQVGVSGTSVRRWCQQAGLHRAQGWAGKDVSVIPANVAPLPARTGHARRLSLAERTKIELRLNDGWSQSRIADDLGVHRSTISRELARNTLRWGRSCKTGGPADSVYNAATAQHHTDYRRARPKTRKLHAHPALRHQVLRLLTHGHSPPQVSVRLRHLFPDDERMRISHESIYQELYLQARSVLLQELKVEVALRSGRTGRIPASKLPPASKRTWLQGCLLADREQMFAAEICERKIPGHWEGDLVVGPGNSALITLVERVSRFTLLGRLPGARDSETVIDKLTQMVESLPEAVLRSLTWDQGSEMAKHARFTVATGCPVFFADPHSPWQRGTNENLNGQLRYEYPKGTNFNTLTDQDIQDTQDRLNHRGRVILAGMTPAEKLDELIAQAQDGVALTT